MATLTIDKRGNQIFQFADRTGKRRTLRLGIKSEKMAQRMKPRIEDLIAAHNSNDRLAISNDTVNWLADISDAMAAKLVKFGLIPERKQKPADATTLDGFIQTYIATRTDVKGSTRIGYEQARTRLNLFFGSSRLLASITPGECDEWVIFLRGKFAVATAARTIKRARQFFTAAIRRKLITENPLDGIKPGKEDNEKRLRFIDQTSAATILDACPSTEWKAIFALARYGGLRVPSEIASLRWGDIDWERNRFLVRSPKLEKTSKGERWVPLFPELRPILAQLFDEAPDGSEKVVQFVRMDSNLGTQLKRIIHRAGLLAWPRLFQNLRSTRETELVAQFPVHVVTAWIGNSAAVAAKHYLQVTDGDFQKAAEGKALHQALHDGQSANEMSSNPAHDRIEKSPQKTMKQRAIASSDKTYSGPGGTRTIPTFIGKNSGF